jgi:hypothetical protein
MNVSIGTHTLSQIHGLADVHHTSRGIAHQINTGRRRNRAKEIPAEPFGDPARHCKKRRLLLHARTLFNLSAKLTLFVGALAANIRVGKSP